MSTKIRPYLSLDLETTGLDVERSQVLQVGWVIEDGKSRVRDLIRGSILVNPGKIEYGELVAINMNAWIFKELTSKGPTKYPVEKFLPAFEQLLSGIALTSALALEFDQQQKIEKPSKRVQLAGKNVGPFDWQLLINNYKRSGHQDPELEAIIKLVDHRFIDCGAAFFPVFGRNPGFQDINKKIDYKEITHDAVEDALNVVVALRHSVGFSLDGEAA